MLNADQQFVAAGFIYSDGLAPIASRALSNFISPSGQLHLRGGHVEAGEHLIELPQRDSLERIDLEIKRRTRVASTFPTTASCLRLVAALMAECDEDWMTGTIYLNLQD